MESGLNTLSCFDAGNRKLSYNIIHLLIGIVFDDKFNDKVEIIDGRLLQSHESNGTIMVVHVFACFTIFRL